MCVEFFQRCLLLRTGASEHNLLQYVRKLVLRSTVSPLEIGACMVILDTGEHECQNVQTVLAILILVLAVCDWHIPLLVTRYGMSSQIRYILHGRAIGYLSRPMIRIRLAMDRVVANRIRIIGRDWFPIGGILGKGTYPIYPMV